MVEQIKEKISSHRRRIVPGAGSLSLLSGVDGSLFQPSAQATTNKGCGYGYNAAVVASATELVFAFRLRLRANGVFGYGFGDSLSSDADRRRQPRRGGGQRQRSVGGTTTTTALERRPHNRGNDPRNAVWSGKVVRNKVTVRDYWQDRKARHNGSRVLRLTEGHAMIVAPGWVQHD